jgi:prepilin-type N-terminal cleavage/methylation domain-containing protein
MNNQKLKIINRNLSRRFCRSGFTIAEMLMALMITGMLLAAIAVAFNASMKNFKDNREIFYAANKARQALTQMVPRIRTGAAFNTSSPSNECNFYENGDPTKHIIYHYNSSDKKLYLYAGGETLVLCDSVTALTFTKHMGGSPPDANSVIISLTVAEGSTSQTFSTAVAIRKNL